MSKHIAKEYFYNLPSGSCVHPSRLIHKDGTLMWKHALLYDGEPYLPHNEAQEQHIVKTAQRLEELNSWVSQDLEPWECFCPIAWFNPCVDELNEGISVYFKHALHDTNDIFSKLMLHTQDHETLEVRGNYLFFKRC